MSRTVVHRALAALIALVLVSGLLAVAAAPTGAATPESALASDARVSARRDVGRAVVFLTVQHGDLTMVVCYPGAKGWFAAAAAPVPRSVELSWTSTRGDGPIPALAAAYGHAAGGIVRVRWADGAVDSTTVGSDGLWLAARAGPVALDGVDILGADGSVVSSETAP